MSMITITIEEYKSLKDDSDWRCAFEEAGVDNWLNFDYAMELYRNTKEENDNDE